MSTAQVQTPPAERSPLEFFHGLYLADKPGYGGATAFNWFEDDISAIEFLKKDLMAVYLEPDESEDINAQLSRLLEGVTTLKGIDRDAVNTVLDAFCEIRWAGSLDDLMIGSEPFEEHFQCEYHGNVYGDERGMGESEFDDIAHHTTHYFG